MGLSYSLFVARTYGGWRIHRLVLSLQVFLNFRVLLARHMPLNSALLVLRGARGAASIDYYAECSRRLQIRPLDVISKFVDLVNIADFILLNVLRDLKTCPPRRLFIF